jgi:uncharacterized LabA/DUF88 family protein
MAVFCDFENVALGVRDANYEKFDIKPVLERLLLKGNIVVKKAYCDWDRYKGFKAAMHEANFELIEIPHVRQSGKNSADIRLVVDALDLCYTKSHVNTFVIISGDSDFSPLVSKLRENAKQVIGVGVKQSTSDLLVANCDEFIFYDDLVREVRRTAAKREERKAQPQVKRPTDDRRKEELEARKSQALEMVAETFDALVSERGDTGKIWASLLKDTLKRRRPDFSETYYGFRTFGQLLEEAQARGLFEFGRDEKSGTYVYRSSTAPAAQQVVEHVQAMPEDTAPELPEELQVQPEAKQEGRGRGRGRGGRKQGAARAETAERMSQEEQQPVEVAPELPEELQVQPEAKPEGRGRGRGRGGRNQGAARAEAAERMSQEEQQPLEAAPEEAPVLAAPEPQEPPAAETAEVAEAPAKERRRTPRAPRKSAAAKKAEAQAAEAGEAPAAPPAPVEAARAETMTEQLAAPETGAEAPEAEAAGKGSRTKSANGSHKAPARKPAARSRRPAKPKATPENG